MKNIHEIFNRFHLLSRLIIVIMIGSLGFLGACSSDDDDAGIDGTSGVSAFNFNENNTRIAAEIAAAAMEFFPAFNQISITVLDILAGETYPPVSPFILPLCTNTGIGSASLSWVDADESGDLTIGDTSTLTFTSCDLDFSGETITGTVDFDTVSLTEIPLSLGINVSINLSINLGTETTTVAGKFSFNTTTADLESFTNLYTAVDNLGQKVTITENGVTYFEVGCFTVTQTYSIASVMSDNYGLAPSGVINASNQILSLNDDSPLTFANGLMNAGTKRLLSVARPECASIGVPGGVSNSDGSYMDMEAIGDGLMVLHTFRADGTEFHTENTSWTALTD
jgi:hypothetical protein